MNNLGILSFYDVQFRKATNQWEHLPHDDYMHIRDASSECYRTLKEVGREGFLSLKMAELALEHFKQDSILSKKGPYRIINIKFKRDEVKLVNVNKIV
jgi:hypothetical protein